MAGFDQLTRGVRICRVDRNMRHLNGGSLYPCLDTACGAFPLAVTDFVVDLVRKPLGVAEMRASHASRFVMADIVHLPFAGKSFSFVHSSIAPQHVKIPAVVLKELQRVVYHGDVETSTWFFDFIIIGPLLSAGSSGGKAEE